MAGVCAPNPVLFKGPLCPRVSSFLLHPAPRCPSWELRACSLGDVSLRPRAICLVGCGEELGLQVMRAGRQGGAFCAGGWVGGWGVGGSLGNLLQSLSLHLSACWEAGASSAEGGHGVFMAGLPVTSAGRPSLLCA